MSNWATSRPPADTATAAIDRAGEGVRLRWQPVTIAIRNTATGGAINGRRRMVVFPIANCPRDALEDGKRGLMFIVTFLISDNLPVSIKD